jgi:hypothetical protein
MSTLAVLAIVAIAVVHAANPDSATGATSHLDALVLVLLGGIFALGLPSLAVRGRRRFWHPWVNSGLLPLLIGLAIGPTQLSWISEQASTALRPLLGLALAAAGVLVGTQLRFAYVVRAGLPFIAKQSSGAFLQWTLAAVPTFFLCLSVFDLPLALGCGALCGACAVATVQRPPLSTDERISIRDVISQHVMPAGWWNILSLVGGSLTLSLWFSPLSHDTEISPQMLLFGTPIVLGLIIGWLALRATKLDDLYLFLLAVLALSGGLALALRAVPLFFGILVGVVLVNVAARKSTALEAVLEELEQPLALGIGLLAGLCLQPQAPIAWIWFIPLFLVLSRWALRGTISPTGKELGMIGERRFASAGSTGVLLIACAVLAPAPAPALAQPLIVGLALLTMVGMGVEQWSVRRVVQAEMNA